MSATPIEPITDMLARWWVVTQAGDRDTAVGIIGQWRAEVIAAAAAKDRGPQ